MKKSIKLVSLLLCALMVVGLLVACGEPPVPGPGNNTGNKPGPDEEIVLVVWSAEADKQFTLDAIDEYIALNPDKKITIQYGKRGENDSATQVLTDVEGGPDIFAFASDQIYKLLVGGALAQFGGANLKEIQDNNTADSVDACAVNGKVYAIPFTDNTFYLYYDKSKFTEEDVKSIDGILAKCSANEKLAIPCNDGWYNSSFYFGAGLDYNVTYSDTLAEESITCDFDSEKGLQVTNAIYDLVASGKVLADADDSKITAGFQDGTVVAAFSGLWNAKSIKEYLGENFACTKLPTYTLNGEQVQLVSFAGYKCLAVNKYSKHMVEAQKLALFLANYDHQVKRFETRGYSPTNIEAQKLDKIKNDPCVIAISQQLLHTHSQKNVPSTFWTPMAGLGDAMINGATGADAFDAQAQLTATIQAIIKAV